MSSVYIVIYFLIFFIALSELNEDKKKSPWLFYSFIALLILVGGFRYYQGADYRIYVNLFYGAQVYVPWDNLMSGEVEPTYIIISKIIGEIFRAPFYWVTFIYALISLSLKGNFFYTFSPYPFLSLLMFYMPVIFFEDYGQMRQGASIAFCAFAFRFIVKKQLLFFILTIIVAYYFHKSAVVFFPAYWIARLRVNTTVALSAIIASIVLWPFEVYRLLGPIIDAISVDTLSEAYTGYLNDSYYGVELGFGLSDIIKFIWLVIIFSVDRQMLPIGMKYLYPRNLTLVFFMIFYLCRGNAIFAVRLPGAYSFYLYLLIPTIIFYAEPYLKRLISTYVFIFSFLILFRFQTNALTGGFGKFNNVLFIKNPQFKNEVF